jgi:Flp pilus assembly protein TadG
MELRSEAHSRGRWNEITAEVVEGVGPHGATRAHLAGTAPAGRRPRGDRCTGQRRAGHRDRGSSVVEAVLIIPIIVLATLLVVQVVLLWHGRHVAQDAARQAAQTARGFEATAGAGRATAGAYLRQVAPRLLQQPRVSEARTGTTVAITVHARVVAVVPGLHLGVDARSEAPLERFVAAS